MIDGGYWPKLNLSTDPRLDWSYSDFVREETRIRGKNPGAEIVGLNRALHVSVLQALGDRAAAAWDAVSEAWGNPHKDVTCARVVKLSKEQIRADVGAHRDAVQIMEDIVALVCERDGRPRQDVLRDLDADLRERADFLRAWKLANVISR